MWGAHVIKTWSVTQNVLALSSAEAELYAVMRAATQVKGIISMASDFGLKMNGDIKCDSSSAISINHREGLGGRCRHISVQYLWIQAEIRNKHLAIAKVPGVENPADLMTKPLDERNIAKHLECMDYCVENGRAAKASKLLNSLPCDYVR